MAAEHYSSSQVARLAGVHVETLRYYERRGLLPPPPRSPAGYRRWPLDTPRRLRFIQRARELGFSLDEIADLLELRVARGASCRDVRARVRARREDVAARLRSLEAVHRALQRLEEACTGRGPTSDCPILDALEKE